MSYIDTSFLTPLFKVEKRSSAVEVFLNRQNPRQPTMSHWTRVEFSSLVAKDVRIGLYPSTQAMAMNAAFEVFSKNICTVLDLSRRDFDLARSYLTDHKTGLRSGDALHLAIASNNGATGIYSLDRTMIAAGQSLGLPMNIGFPAFT